MKFWKKHLVYQTHNVESNYFFALKPRTSLIFNIKAKNNKEERRRKKYNKKIRTKAKIKKRGGLQKTKRGK